MRKAIHVIKLLMILFIISCDTQSKIIDQDIEFLNFYFSEHLNNTKVINLSIDNSNTYVLKALSRYVRNKSKQNELISKLLDKNGLKKVEEQTVKNTEWNNTIKKAINNINISSKNINTIYVSKPIFIDNYCLVYSYKKTNETYFIPSIEVFLNDKGWKQIEKIRHFK